MTANVDSAQGPCFSQADQINKSSNIFVKNFICENLYVYINIVYCTQVRHHICPTEQATLYLDIINNIIAAKHQFILE